MKPRPDGIEKDALVLVTAYDGEVNVTHELCSVRAVFLRYGKWWAECQSLTDPSIVIVAQAEPPSVQPWTTTEIAGGENR